MKAEELLRNRLQSPMLRLRYTGAMGQVEWKLKMVNADLSMRQNRQVIRSMTGRIKDADSIARKLRKKGKPVTLEAARECLNDIAGIRVVCYFCDDIDLVAEALRRQQDLRIVKEKDYVRQPKRSGYQSVHMIVGVPICYERWTEEIRVEIQIRSFAMDYWAELDTQMCYKKEHGQAEHVEKKISGYSAILAGVDNQMLELRRSIER
jgi:putative GTP pyrophosphokinase